MDLNNLEELVNSNEFSGLYKSIQESNLTRLKDLPDTQKRVALAILMSGRNDIIDDLWRLVYKRKVPTIEEFVSPDYIGDTGNMIFKQWRRELGELFSPSSSVYEWIVTGAIGTGKSTATLVAHFYNKFRIDSMKSPQVSMGVAPTTVMILQLFSVTLKKSDESLLDPMETLLNDSNYYQQVDNSKDFGDFNREEYSHITPWYYDNYGDIVCPNNVKVDVGSQEQHALGMAIYGASLDEAEFRRGYDVERVFRLYGGLKERLRSRFLGQRNILITMVSSSQHSTGVIASYIKRIPKSDPYTKVSQYAIWDVKFPEAMSKGHFWVMRGTNTHPSRMLNSDEESQADKGKFVNPPGTEIIRVPLIYKADFERTVERSLMDLAGIVTIRDEKPFDDLSGMLDKNLTNEINIVAPLKGVTPLIRQLPQHMLAKTPDGFRLNRYPAATRYCHADLADTGEGGFGMCHKEASIFGQIIYVFDLVIKITSPNRISFESINEFFYDLARVLQIPIAKFTADRYQSTATLQYMETKMVAKESKILSVDKTAVPYQMFSSAVGEHSVKVGYCYTLWDQMDKIYFDKGTGKTNVLKPYVQGGGRKDVADGVCLSEDTRITLLDGTTPTIESLYKEDRRDFWVISCDTENKKIVPGKVLRATKNPSKGKIIKITLDNEQVVSCTLDHILIRRDGTEDKAENLKVGDSLMPLYIYERETHKDYYKNYKNPFTNKEESLYRMVSRETKQSEVSESWKRAYKDGSKFALIHHKDHNKINDTPKNLIPLTNNEHRKIHGDIFVAYNKSDYKRKRTSELNSSGYSGFKLQADLDPEGFSKRSSELGTKNITKYNKSDEHKVVASRVLAEYNRSEEGRATSRANGKRAGDLVSERYRSDPEFKLKMDKVSGDTLRRYNRYQKYVKDNSLKKEEFTYKVWKETIDQNHKIVDIWIEDSNREVYDLVMDKYHNFRIEAGIFVHNCGALFNAINATNDIPIHSYENWSKLQNYEEEEIPSGFEKV